MDTEIEVRASRTEAPPPGFYRLTGLAGLVGGVLAIISNAMHPRLGPDKLTGPGSTEAFLELIDGYSLWRIDHLLIILSVMLALFALVGLARSLTQEGASAWAGMCLPFALVTGAVATVSFALDGLALGGIGEQWGAASGPAKAEILTRAHAVLLVDQALFTVAIMGLFGTTQLIYGLALSKSALYPKWLGPLGIAGGVLGLASGTIQWMAGELNVASFLVLFTLTSVIFTILLIAISLQLYRRV